MYERHFALQARPFELTPDPRFFFDTPAHREALSTLRYGLDARKGIVVITGEAGTGKTTVLRVVTADLESQGARIVHVNHPRLTAAEFYETLARGLGLGAGAMLSKPVLLDELRASLVRDAEAGRLVAVVVDEAQSLPYELLEEIRLLANIETDRAKLLQVVLAGQPEFSARLNEPQLRQLKQRVALRCSIAALDGAETAAFVAGRVRLAGGEPTAVFTAAAIHAVHAYSGGIARWINVLCDNALLAGFAIGRRPVDADLVASVARDFDLVARDAPAAGAIPLPPAADAPRASEDAGAAEPPSAIRRDLFQTVGRRRRLSFLFG